MGGETAAKNDCSDSHLQTAFNKLIVDNQWSLDQSASNVKNVNDLWAGSSAPTSKKPQRLCERKGANSSARRMEPYPQDFLCSIEKLSFHAEDCKKKSCRCSELRLKSRKHFNYANSSVHHRPIIREAKLKLHHSDKDTKQLIRAARLKIFKKGKQSEERKQLAKSTLSKDPVKPFSPPSPSCEPSVLFGAKSSANSQDFGSLFNGSSGANKSNDTFKFSDYRSQSHKRTRDQAYIDSPNRNSYIDCGQEMRNHEGAAIEDTSVDELAGYFEDYVHIPKKMSSMAEMMYT
ncbi:oxidative stress-responsive serine-rich protein 1-like [Mya arenaria]|uniref:oxidative stress-responsive serine-rich protein 1-like n=1 Tax=Mya arenaria TaxID=6604 RepID=UPI0022DF8306|nr:oxidative stress-responsive serine-rich protein 1-like [Mya arenaria]